MKNFTSLFQPFSIAVIGASSKGAHVGNAVFSNIVRSGFSGVVFPVNPNEKSILCMKSYPDIGSVPGAVDLAIICVPKEIVIKVAMECSEMDVKGLIVISSGFRETGEEGTALENELSEIVNTKGISLVGPNCLGIINTSATVKLNASFSAGMPLAGKTGLISQSGAVGIAALEYANRYNLGISKFVSIGNKATIDETDMLEFFLNDDETKVIAIYAEDISRPQLFLGIAKAALSKNKPVIIIKTGRTLQGAMAARSHTGALSSSDIAYDSLFAQCGVIRVETLNELFECAKAFSYSGRPHGKKLAIVTNAGGLGVLATDSADRSGLEMAKFADTTVNTLKEILPVKNKIGNPVDLIGNADAKRFKEALAILVKDSNIDLILVCAVPQMITPLEEIAEVVYKCSLDNPEIFFVLNLMSLTPDPGFVGFLESINIPNFDFPEIAVKTLGNLVRYSERTHRPYSIIPKFNVNAIRVKEILAASKRERRSNLTEPEMYEILIAYGVNVLNFVFSGGIQESIVAANKIGYPVVIKIVSPDIQHKVDLGLVELNIKNDEELKSGFIRIKDNFTRCRPGSVLHGFIVQKFFTGPGLEVIIGGNEIKGFGDLMMFGFGGTYVEVFKDVAFRLVPLTEYDAWSMITQIKGYQILKGFRGQGPFDVNAAIDCLLRISQLLSDFPEIKGIEVNPFRILKEGSGMVAMDAKGVLNIQT